MLFSLAPSSKVIQLFSPNPPHAHVELSIAAGPGTLLMQIGAAPVKLCQRAPAEDVAFCSSSDCHPGEDVTHSLGPERSWGFFL